MEELQAFYTFSPPTRVSTGFNHSVVLTREGHVYTFGDNSKYQLGDGTDISRRTPLLIKLPPAYEIRAGSRYTAVVMENGDLATFGTGSKRSPGVSARIPTRIPVPERVISVATGDTHLVILTESGKVYTMGRGSDGQPGTGDSRDRPTPTLVSLANRVLMISSVFQHTAVLTSIGEVYVWGSSQQAHLSDSRQPVSTPLKVRLPLPAVLVATGPNSTAIVLEDQLMYAFGLIREDSNMYLTHIPTFLPVPRPVQSLSIGENSFTLLTTKGVLYPFFRGTFGSINPSRTSAFNNVREASAGTGQILLVDFDGQLYGLGTNEQGQLGLGEVKEVLEPERVEVPVL